MNKEPMKKWQRYGITAVLILGAFCLTKAFAQWGPATGYWQVGSGGFALNCPANSCSVGGSVLNFPGLSAKNQLVSDNAGSSTNTLIDSGITFPIAANQNGTLNCTIFFTNSSGGGLTLGVNGPGSPTEVTAAAEIESAATTGNFFQSQGTSWAAKLGTATSTVTTIQYSQLTAGIENGSTAGTLSVQYADVNTTGTTIIKRDSFCSFP